ncbi:MAG: ATP-dependent Clp protease proteolytic subunit [Candidatus Nanohaloarchaea archaeon]
MADEYYFLLLTDPSSIELGDDLEVMSELQKIDNADEITLVLNTAGGDVYTATKIVDAIRQKCDTLEIVVPYSAKSAGTVMIWGGR